MSGASPASVASGSVRAVLLGVLLGACGGSDSRVELWYAGTALCGFTHGQLQGGGGGNPAIIVTSRPLSAFSDVALDASGNVWAVGVGSNDVLRFPAAALRKSGMATPDLTIRSAALQSPGSLAFDGTGNLWVANRKTETGTAVSDYGTIVRFENAQSLSGAQDVTPAVRIGAKSANDFYLLGAIAFDASGNLWVTSFAGMLRFDDPRRRSGEVAVAPDAVIEKAGYPGNVYFYALAFDATGALWAAAAAGALENSIMKFTNPGSLLLRSSPAPAATIAGTAAGDILPAGGLAFDADGNLWTANSETILMYARPGELSGKVDPAPAKTLSVFNQASPSLNSHLVFFPPPQGGDR